MSSDATESSLQSPVVECDTASSSDESSVTKSVEKTARDQFYTGIKITDQQKSWEATCQICKSKVRGTVGVTSNYNRHIKDCHPNYYESWQEQLQAIGLRNQKKITETMDVRKPKSSSGSIYSATHPRQVELQKSIVEDLIIELGLPLSLVEREGFNNFMLHVDSKFSTISRRTLSRSILPNLYTKMLDGLKRFCSKATFISMTLDL
ncbi:unnamed protein product [Adineta ricciae]|uniref:BED-type domain-containing protein n=1 Tax=Adineta ricciae TaxID=249248 RepID=A0A815NCF3_ADIRI|nr:unnamed protein product [Adineta ricciae]CAF1437497.1 unnamed protein product [Adineta ricciae]